MKLLSAITSCLLVLLSACSAKNGEPAPSAPGVPQELKLNGYTDNSLTFKWKTVKEADSYDWSLTDLTGVTLTGKATVRYVEIGNLTKGMTYQFKVRSVAGELHSDWTEEVEGIPGGKASGTDPGPTDKWYDQFNMPAAEEDGKVRAFPGAEGCGMFTSGGRGGDVYHVTSLADSGPGSLRYGIEELKDLEKKGTRKPRTIVFDVAGVISLQSPLDIWQGDLTIAGQTAPGDGICIKGYPFRFKDTDVAGLQDPHNVIIRFIRCRMGDETKTADDAMTGRQTHHVIVDHCSLSWCTDECASFYDNRAFTMQWCFISESLFYSVHGKGAHGYGGIWGGEGATFHHNLVAHHTIRTPRLCGSRYTGKPEEEKVELANNVFYNWGPINGGYAGEGGSYNFVNNYYKPGPATAYKDQLVNRIFSPEADDGSYHNVAGTTGVFHLSGNVFDAGCSALSEKQKGLIASVNADNWVGLQPKNIDNTEALRSQTRFDISADGSTLTLQDAATACARVLAGAGASLRRDAVDTRIAQEVRDGNYTYIGTHADRVAKYGAGTLGGIIDSQADAGGWPAYEATAQERERCLDSDGDGMPDWFEDAFGLDKTDGADGNWKNLDKYGRYTNLEMYLHYLVKDIVAAQRQ